MRTIKTITLIIIALVFCFSVKAQVVPGSNLNIGENNTLTQTGTTFHSNAIGKNNYLEGVNSLTVGENDTILYPGGASVALGSYNKVAGNASFAIGSNVKVQGLRCIGVGHLVKVTGSSGITIGSGLLGSTHQPNLFLENNSIESLTIGFHSTKPTLTVGPSPNDYPNGNLFFDLTGKIAIGDVPMPDIAAKLHIRSDMGEDAGLILEPKDPENSNTFIRLRDEYHGIEVDKEGAMNINAGESPMTLQSTNITLSGKVGINTTNESDTYTLAVDGGILTNEVLIKEVDDWYDNVFEKDYNLLSLSELQQFIDDNGHLPEVPSETEVKEEGYKMAKMQGLLLKKIEELTLYTLKQQELIEKMEKRIGELEGNKADNIGLAEFKKTLNVK